jgi:hypothetical protein
MQLGASKHFPAYAAAAAARAHVSLLPSRWTTAR